MLIILKEKNYLNTNNITIIMKNSDWILYYSQKWLDEEINQRGLKNENQLYWATLCDTRLKDTKVEG
jgi:hypothetical protein